MKARDPTSIEAIAEALQTAAQITLMYGSRYPEYELLFDRLERELNARQSNTNKADRLKQIAAGD